MTKRRVIRILVFGLLLGAGAFLTYRRESYSITCFDTLSKERYSRVSVFGIPLRTTQTSMTEGYREQFELASGRTYDGKHRFKSKPDAVIALGGGTHRDFGWSFEYGQRLQLLQALYTSMQSESIPVAKVRAQFAEIEAVLPFSTVRRRISPDTLSKIDDLREDLGLDRQFDDVELETRN